jgi:hypothetical protein
LSPRKRQAGAKIHFLSLRASRSDARRALFWGMILIHVFLVSKLAIWVLYGFNHEQISLFVLSPFWKQILSLTVNVFLQNLTFRLIVSFFIWILVTFRRKDWPGILMQKNARPKKIWQNLADKWARISQFHLKADLGDVNSVDLALFVDEWLDYCPYNWPLKLV